MSIDADHRSEWRYVIDADMLEDEDVLGIEVCDEPIALYRLDGKFYATQDRCTHGGALLSHGVVVGDVIECAIHQGRFCIRTGKPRGGPVRDALRTYPVRLEGGRVYVCLPSSRNNVLHTIS